ncbi:C-type lectin galactose-binding isoform-like [Ictalurus punctatus]|uniref:C-type lectin galactose-binding isoform-like n=1 Tax=Ictalurus punctatus TaxID=7998 RepID=A0A9F7R084_ICTPU|nr:C-type lectin galactose-binding isoform-like [Ictalurus punctatus]
MMKFVSIFFLVGSCGLVEGMIREYIHYPYTTDWYNAQQICREHHTDLATISTTEEQQRLVESFGFSSGPAWIGLYTESVNSEWQWSHGEPVSFLPWYPDYPDNINYIYIRNRKIYDRYESCAFLEQGQWKNNFCGARYPYYCYRYLILVNESKTWEEALRYCTTKYTGLASLSYATQVLQAKTELALTQTESVWTGLRFMDGNWFWLSGEPTQSLDLLPSCPAHHCGALNNNTNIWENRDCNENLNFLCYLNIM